MARSRTVLLAILCAFTMTLARDALAADKPDKPEGKLTADDLPPLTDADKLVLLKTARAELKRRLVGEEAAPIPKPTKAILDADNRVYVTIRLGGELQACMSAEEENLSASVRQAIGRCLRDDRFGMNVRGDNLRRVRIELDVIGPSEKIAGRTPKDYRRQVEPGIHGIGVRRGKGYVRFKDSVAVTHDYTLPKLLQRICRKARYPQTFYADPRCDMVRFRSLHFTETDGFDGVLNLHRAWPVPRDVTLNRRELMLAVSRGLRFLVKHQQEDGSFLYKYYPAKDRPRHDVNIVRMAGTTWSVGRAARLTGDKAGVEAYEKALAFMKKHIRYLNLDRDYPYIIYKGRPPLGAAALLVLALVEGPEDKERLELARGLARSMLTLQEESGRFRTFFPPIESDANQDYYPGEALLALMTLYKATGDDTYLDAVKKAFEFYPGYFERHAVDGKRMSFCPWQTAANYELYKVTRNDDHYIFCKRMTDWVLTHQYREPMLPWSDYLGGFSFGFRGMPGFSTATFSEGVVDGYRAAKLAGDELSIKKYRDALALSIPFVMRLQVRLRDTYFMPRPDKAVGGFRAALSFTECRCDYAQHAIVALMKFMEAFDDEELAEMERTRPRVEWGAGAPETGSAGE